MRKVLSVLIISSLSFLYFFTSHKDFKYYKRNQSATIEITERQFSYNCDSDFGSGYEYEGYFFFIEESKDPVRALLLSLITGLIPTILILLPDTTKYLLSPFNLNLNKSENT